MTKKRVKVLCELCKGDKKETVAEFGTGLVRDIKCRACHGRGYYLYEAA